MTNYFELFDLPESLQPDKELVRKRWQEISRVYHPDRFGNATIAEQSEALQRSALANEAYRTFTNEDRTLAYVLKMHGVLEEEEKYALPPDFLMEMMDLNELLDSQGSSDNGTASAELDAQFGNWNSEMKPLIARYNGGDRNKELLLTLKDYYFRKKYLLRLKERMA